MPDAVAELRSFSRFYTAQLELLGPGLLDTPHTLAESRVLFELAQQERVEVADLRRADADRRRPPEPPARRGWSAAAWSPASARRPTGAASVVAPDAGGPRGVRGRSTARSAERDRRAARGARRDRPRPARGRAGRGAAAARPGGARRAVVLRPPRPGDLGWIVERHGAAVRATSTAGTRSFEALVAADRRRLRRDARPGARGRVDRRARRRARRLRCSACADERRRRQAAAAARRAAGARRSASARGWSTSASASPAAPATPS